MPDPTFPAPLARKGGPVTPEGKACAARNAIRHGLRARTFALLPGEDEAAFAALRDGLIATFSPIDTFEAELVRQLAAAFWQVERAERLATELLEEIVPEGEATPHGGDLLDAEAHRAGLGTVLRYQTTAQNAARRAQAMLLQHRKARRVGLVVVEDGDAEANEACTNEPQPPAAPANDDDAATPATGAFCTNERTTPIPAPLPDDDPAPPMADAPALRHRLKRLLDRSLPKAPDDLDLAEAVCALLVPEWPEYRGPLPLPTLAEALDGVPLGPRQIDWLAGRELALACARS